MSKIYPTGGIDGTNKYTLETAIAKIPASLKTVGIKCSFLTVDGNFETWTYQGGTYNNADSWMQGGSGSGGNMILEWDTDVATTRKQIPYKIRKKGLEVTYNMPNFGWIRERLIGDIPNYSDAFIEQDQWWNIIYESDTIFVDFDTDKKTTRNKIPVLNRRYGLKLKYLDNNNNLVEEIYFGVSATSTSFGTQDYCWADINDYVEISSKGLTGKIDKGTGEIINSAEYGYTELIDLSLYTVDDIKVLIKNNSGDDAVIAAFYDGNKKYIGNYSYDNTYIVIDNIRSILNNVRNKFVSFCFNKNNYHSVYIRKKFEYEKNYQNLATINKSLAKKINPTIQEGPYFTTNGSTSTNATWGTSDYIDINGATYIEAYSGTYYNNIFTLVFFDEGYTFLSGIQAENAETKIQAKIPEKAKYVKLQSQVQIEYKYILLYSNYNFIAKEGIGEFLFFPKIIYNVGNDFPKVNCGYNRNYSTVLYLDNFYYTPKIKQEPDTVFKKNMDVKLAIPCYYTPKTYDTPERIKWCNGQNAYEENVQIELYGDNVDTFELKNRCCINSVTMNTQIRVLLMGDSITVGTNAYFPGINENARYTTLLNKMFFKDCVDYGLEKNNCITLGTCKYTEENFEYNKKKLDATVYNEGYSGKTINTAILNSPKFKVDNVFSFKNWLDQYRTMTPDGKRLYFDSSQKTTGTGGNYGYTQDGQLTEYKIGTFVTNVLNYNVCEPTHIFCFHGTNDSNSKTMKNDYDTFINNINEVFPNAYIALGVPHTGGTIFPSKYPGFLNMEYWNNSDGLATYKWQEVLQEMITDEYEQKKTYILPTFFVNPAALAVGSQPINEPFSDFIGGNTNYIPKGHMPFIHVGGYAHAAYAYQLYAWIKWTIAKDLA